MEIIIAFCILALPMFPLFRLCTNLPFIRGSTRIWAFILFGLAIYLFALLALLLAFPILTVPASILTLVIIALERWHARASYGAVQNLPPGSLAFLPIDLLTDQLALLKRAAKYGPIFKLSGTLRRAGMSRWFAPMVCVVGLERAHELLSQHSDMLESPEPPYSRLIPRGVIRYMNDADHRVYRTALQKIFSPEIIAANEPFSRAQIQKTLAAMSATSAEIGSGISPAPYLRKMVCEIWLKIFFGITLEDHDAVWLEYARRWLDRVDSVHIQDAKVIKSLEPIFSHLRERMERPRAPRTGSYFDQMLDEARNASDDPALVWNLIITMENSAADVVAYLSWIVKMLSDHPEWLGRVRADTAPSFNLAERIAMETLRMAQSEYLIRRTRDEIKFSGYSIPKGWIVRIGIRESHLDPNIFQQPFTFDPDRFLERDYARTEYAPFGMGSRSCLGVSLTLSIAKLLVAEVARGYEMVITADGPVEFHRFHWRPSSQFRVQLVTQPLLNTS